MGAVRQILPYVFVIFFIIKGNKHFIYLLGIPFLMFMSNSIFFENAKVFQIPGSISSHLIFLWLILLWLLTKIVSKKITRSKNINSLNIVDFCVIGLILISIFGLIRTLKQYFPYVSGIWDEFFIETSLLFAYFIIKNWVSSNRPEAILNFIYSLVMVNSIACVLFILHQGLHLNIYISDEYVSESFQGQQITRTFWFMPQFSFLSIAFLLGFKNKFKLLSFVLLCINLLAILITYTISAVAIAILIVFLYFVLVGIKQKKIISTFGNLAKYGLIALIGFFVISKFLPANINYLLSRVSEQTDSNYTTGEPNDMDARIKNTKLVISNIDPGKKLFGMGPITQEQSSKIAEMKDNTADIVWSGVIFYWGYIGLLLFVLIYLYCSVQAFKFFMKFDGITSDLALILLLYIISQFLDGFVSWTFLSGHGIATGLWYFSLLSALPKIKDNWEISKVKMVHYCIT